MLIWIKIARRAVPILWAAIAATSLSAQSSQTPAFKATVDAVRLDVRVVADDGSFVRGMTKDDLRVFEDGQEQTITTFSMVELSPPANPDALPESDVSSNASFRDGRVYLLMLDDLHIHDLRAQTVRELARRFIEQHTTPADRVAIATTSGIDLGSQDFTNDRRQLLEAVARFTARVLPEAASGDLPAFAIARAEAPADAPAPLTAPTEVLPLRSLLSSVEWLGTVPDRRKALVFISEGVPSESPDPEVLGTLQEIFSAAARANVAIYPVDAHGLPTAPSGAVKPVVSADDEPISDRRRTLQAGLRLLADETGGAAVVNSNAFDPLFARVVADSSAYYLLGYNSTQPSTKKLRRLEVRLTRPGFKVQARRAYGAPSARMAKRAAPPAGMPAALGAAFQSPVPITDIELAVTASPLRGSGNRASVAIVVEAQGTHEMEVFIAASQADGKVQASKRGTLKPAGNSGETVMQSTAKLDLKPGRYHLRVAALREDTGARGSVLRDFEVPDFSKEPLAISGVTLVNVQRGRTPTTRRTFARSEAIDVSAEVYWKRGTTQSISIAATVVNDRGEVVYQQDGVVDPRERPRLGVDFGATIKLDEFSPGVYRLSVAARTTGEKAVSAKREVAFIVMAR